jgi:Ca-activated chloride channel family protein
MQANAKFTLEQVRFDQETKTHLVVTLTAPKLDWETKRSPICIIPVIDVSGSMDGEKLEYAKQSALKLTEHLRPGDYCGLVTFSDDVYAIQAPVEMAQSTREELRLKIGALHAMSCTNFSGGMLQGLEWANKTELPDGMLVRVIMFTDGLANRGVSDQTGLLQLLQANRGKATLSAFGYGSDANQDLLATLAREGQGNYAFVKNPEDALTAFAKELGGLLSTYAQNLVVDLAPHGEHKLIEVVSDVDVTEAKDKIVIKLPDILSEEVRHLVIAVQLAVQSQALPRDMSVVDIKLDYDVLEQGKKSHRQEELKAKVRFVKEGEEQKTPDPALDKLVAQAQMVQAQIAAEKHVAAGNYTAAQNVMLTFCDDVKLRGHLEYVPAIEKLHGATLSPDCYQANSGYWNSTKGITTRSAGISSADPEAVVLCCAAGIGGTDNAAKLDMLRSFGAPGGNAPPPVHGSFVTPAKATPPAAPKPGEPQPSNSKKHHHKSQLSKKRSRRW